MSFLHLAANLRQIILIAVPFLLILCEGPSVNAAASTITPGAVGVGRGVNDSIFVRATELTVSPPDATSASLSASSSLSSSHLRIGNVSISESELRQALSALVKVRYYLPCSLG